MYKVALAGNPNTGKSTLFNLLTGLRQHTGNWSGKTVTFAKGSFQTTRNQYQLVDLPGTYSLYSNSADEEVARDYIIFQKPHVTIVVLDATALERNLNLALQVLEMSERVIICINLMDEAEKNGISIDEKKLSSKLGVPVLKISARNQIGITRLLETIDEMVEGKLKTDPLKLYYGEKLEAKIEQLEPRVANLIGNRFPSRWIAIRLLDGDRNLIEALKKHLTIRMEKEVMMDEKNGSQ